MSEELIDHEGDVHEVADRQSVQKMVTNEFLETDDDTDTEENPFAFRVVTAEDEEFYSKLIPIIVGDELRLFEAVQKCTAEATILATKLEQYYAVPVNTISVVLSEGILLKRVPVSELTWLSTTKEMAEGVLKDEELMYYQTVVPELLRKVSVLEQRAELENEAGPGPLIKRKNDLRL